MALTAGLLALLGAAGTVGGAYLSSQQQSKGGPEFTEVPEDPYISAARAWVTRNAIANAGKTAPSFSDFLGSGGTARFDLDLSGFTPAEAKNLRLVSKEGKAIPFFDPARQTSFTEEQRLYLGRQQAEQGKDTVAARMFKKLDRANRMGRRLEGPYADPYLSPKKRLRLENRRRQALQDYNRLRERIERESIAGALEE